MSKKNSIIDMLTFGFALFAMFFGAGNLIFPPYLGVLSGSSWFITFLGFTVTAVGLALVAFQPNRKETSLSFKFYGYYVCWTSSCNSKNRCDCL